MKEIFKNILAMLAPAKRNNCPYCGGIKCLGRCSLEQNNGKKEETPNR